MTDTPVPGAPSVRPPSTRLASIDAYRGLVMFLMMAEVLRLRHVAEVYPDSAIWQFLEHHTSHVTWIGCSLHDLIQPSFSFLVGVALVFSLASRRARGQSPGWMTVHACWRALVLVFLGIFLRSIGNAQTNFVFHDTLTQIGLGYVFLFLLGFRPRRDQWIALGLILVGYWLAFVLYPAPGPDFNYAQYGLSAEDWADHSLTGFASHWCIVNNPAWAFDRWFLNILPQVEPFLANRGGTTTLNFIPTLATMILGLLAGGVLRGERSAWAKARWLAVAGVVALASGWLLGWLGVCPVIKRLWTPSWVLFSGGWCFLILAAFYAVLDIQGWKAWAFPLIVIGMNSITAYCMAEASSGFIMSSLKCHLGSIFFNQFGEPYQRFALGIGTLLVYWLILFWMYRKRIFVRV